jgi:3-phosphoglycerate kinase
MGLDIGPDAIKQFQATLKDAKVRVQINMIYMLLS